MTHDLSLAAHELLFVPMSPLRPLIPNAKVVDTNSVVILDNSNLKIATSRNYHHFFPKKYLEEREPGSVPNLIADITLIDGYSKTPEQVVGEIAYKSPDMQAYVPLAGSDPKEVIKALDDFEKNAVPLPPETPVAMDEAAIVQYTRFIRPKKGKWVRVPPE